MHRDCIFDILEGILDLLAFGEKQRHHHTHDACKAVDYHWNWSVHLGNQRTHGRSKATKNVANAEDLGANDRREVVGCHDVAQGERYVDTKPRDQHADQDCQGVAHEHQEEAKQSCGHETYKQSLLGTNLLGYHSCRDGRRRVCDTGNYHVVVNITWDILDVKTYDVEANGTRTPVHYDDD